MFRALARRVNQSNPADRADTILSSDPTALAALLAAGWSSRGRAALGGVPRRSIARLGAFAPARIPWDHLIYAYMIENTRIYEIFRRIVWELLQGERLGFPISPVTYRWLETTEELFHRDGFGAPLGLVSRLRPDLAAARRNAYFRMFGMDLNHGADGGSAYPYEKPAAANREFVATFEEFLREVWRAIENATNTSGPRQTDPAAIADLGLRLQNMLNARRGGTVTDANLARDEFIHVSTMSWFHLTVDANTTVVRDLKAVAPSPEERLRLIAERAGMAAHARSHNFFVIASRISLLLIQLELGWYSTPGGARNLYAPPSPPPATNPLQDNVMIVINQWSMVTGRDIKAGKVTVSPRSEPQAMPVQGLTSRATATPAGGNGRTPAAAGASQG